jgi:hypothetical protein
MNASTVAPIFVNSALLERISLAIAKAENSAREGMFDLFRGNRLAEDELVNWLASHGPGRIAGLEKAAGLLSFMPTAGYSTEHDTYFVDVSDAVHRIAATTDEFASALELLGSRLNARLAFETSDEVRRLATEAASKRSDNPPVDWAEELIRSLRS